MSKLYSIYDSKAKAYLQPLHFRQAGEALRAFENEINSGKETSMIARYPADYTLFEIGEWDEFSGEIRTYEAKVNLGTGIQFQLENVVKAIKEA